jgi:hypothetical protein
MALTCFFAMGVSIAKYQEVIDPLILYIVPLMGLVEM